MFGRLLCVFTLLSAVLFGVVPFDIQLLCLSVAVIGGDVVWVSFVFIKNLIGITLCRHEAALSLHR